MKLFYYTFLSLLFGSISLWSQSGIQRNYLDSVNYVEVPIPVEEGIDEQAIIDSIQNTFVLASQQAKHLENVLDQTKNIRSASVPADHTDSLALVALYNATNGPSWRTSWDLNQPVSTWYGVVLEGNGYVVQLDLYENALEGTLPNEIGDFNAIQHIGFNYNNLTGSLPASIGNLTTLESISFFQTNLSGELPTSIGNLVNLIHLEFYSNRLSGALPSSLSNLVNLDYLLSLIHI